MKTGWPKRSRFRRVAGAATALVLVTGAGASSAIFVDYLADRARLRAYAAATEKPAEAMQAKTASVTPMKAAFAAPVKAASASTVKTKAPAKTPSKVPVKTSSVTGAPASVAGAPKPEAAPHAASIALAAKAAITGSLPGVTSVEGKTAVIAESAAGSRPDRAAALSLESGVEAEGDIEPVLAAGETGPGDETYTSAIPAPRPSDDTAAVTALLPDKGEEQPQKAKKTGRAATVLKYVNLRSRPADESKVLAVVPAKAKVTVLSCKGWCKVEYEGTRGFIYKSFIGKS